jgi:hypothetical protein
VSSETEDNVRIDPRLIRIGLEALDAVSEKQGIDFFSLDLEQKKAFLVDHGPDVVTAAKRAAGPLARYFNDRMVVLIENEGNAGLYFLKVKPHGK